MNQNISVSTGKLKIYSLLGVLGGIAFMIGDCLLFCYPGYTNADIDPLWSGVSEWRFICSAWLGFLGMSLMLPAFLSFYLMISKTCGRIMKTMTTFMLIGVASTGFLHFVLGSLLPITYKAVLETAGADAAYTVSDHWRSILAPLDAVLIGILALEYIVHFVAVISGKTGLPRLFCLLGPLGALLLGLLWRVVFQGTAAEGAFGACESLGEALVFLTSYLYWRKSDRQKN